MSNNDTLIFMKGNYIWKKFFVKPKKNFARCKEDMTWKIVVYQVYIRNTTGIKTVMQTWQYIGGVEMLYKKVAGFEDYDILEPAIKEIDIMNFQNKTEKECVDVPFTIVGKEKETEEDKQKMEISDSFVTGFAIFVITFGLLMLKICWV